MSRKFEIIPATKKDIPIILSFIKNLAEHVDLSNEVVATEKELQETLFDKNSHVEILVGFYDKEAISFVLFFSNYSTFLGKPGIYVEDMYIKPEYRGMGFGKTMFRYIATLAIERNYGKIEWYAAESNDLAIGFYRNIGAKPLERRKIFRLAGEALQNLADSL
jgi:ribosomal protein S18 acetylase RimI-like enzyme